MERGKRTGRTAGVVSTRRGLVDLPLKNGTVNHSTGGKKESKDAAGEERERKEGRGQFESEARDRMRGEGAFAYIRRTGEKLMWCFLRKG